MIHEMITRLNRVGLTSGFATFWQHHEIPIGYSIGANWQIVPNVNYYVFSMYFVSLIRFMRMTSINMLKSIPMRNTDN